MKRIYISGPITGIDDYMEKFSDVEKILNLIFPNKVMNPAKVLAALPTENTSWNEYMNVSIELLKMCDCIFMLDGWENSKGARLEYDYAKHSGYEIYFQDVIGEK